MNTTHTSLLVRLKNRADDEAWWNFKRIYHPLLRRYARGRGLDKDAIEDVIADCFKEVVEHIAAYRRIGSFRGWLKRMAVNKVNDRLRPRREQQIDSGAWNRQSDRSPSPEQLYDEADLDEHLRYCLDALRRRLTGARLYVFQALVIQRRLPAEVARELGLTVNNVYVIKSRLLDELLTELRDVYGSDLDSDDA